jgi:hypothetical protein
MTLSFYPYDTPPVPAVHMQFVSQAWFSLSSRWCALHVGSVCLTREAEERNAARVVEALKLCPAPTTLSNASDAATVFSSGDGTSAVVLQVCLSVQLRRRDQYGCPCRSVYLFSSKVPEPLGRHACVDPSVHLSVCLSLCTIVSPSLGRLSVCP